MRLALATKISLAVMGVLALASLSSLVTILSARRFETFQEIVVTENLASVKAAEELEIALLEQRGYVSSYILAGGDPKWLKQLEEKRRSFEEWLGRARNSARTEEEREILDRLEIVQEKYASKRGQVVTIFNEGRDGEAKRILLNEVEALHDGAYDLCEQFIKLNERLVSERSADIRRQVQRLTTIVTGMLIVALGLGLTLLWMFFQGVVFPLRRLAVEARTAAGETDVGQRDDLRELGRYMELLMADVAETRSNLEHSRQQLAYAEKLAGVGKLAASVAHEIRDPLTSVKMWLYSLRRSFGPDDESRQKIDVISEEINRLESIVRDFLEFSRPQQPRRERHNVARVLRRTLEVARFRLEEHFIEVVEPDYSCLPEILGDSEQLMQVIGNLVNNAIDAMPNGGTLRVASGTAWRGRRQMVTIRIADSGPGVPEEVQRRLFEPFFTTKPGGTGLGLCIAATVLARHGGALTLESSSADGTAWLVWIPIAEAVHDGDQRRWQ